MSADLVLTAAPGFRTSHCAPHPWNAAAVPARPAHSTLTDVPTYEKRSIINAPASVLFAWHARPGAFERLAPPWEHLRVLSRYGGITDGSRVTFEVRRGPLRARWEALHRDFVDGVQFTDVQVSGPFGRWEHVHRVEPDGTGRSTLIDVVDYALPFGPIGALAAGVFGDRFFDRLFGFRHRRIACDLDRHLTIGRGRRLRLVLTGRTGWVLTQLAAFLSTGGHLVHLFPTPDGVPHLPRHAAWGPSAVPDFAALEQADAVINMGLEGLDTLLTALGDRGSRARTVVAIPTLAGPGAVPIPASDLEEAIARSPRRVVVLATPGVLVAWPAVKGSVPRETVSPSLDGPLIALDDLIGAVYYALCNDAVRGLYTVALPRPGATAAVPPEVAQWVPELRVLRLRGPEIDGLRPLTAEGFTPLNPDLSTAVRAEMGWP